MDMQKLGVLARCVHNLTWVARVYTTENMFKLARQTAFFFQGKVIEVGPTDHLYTRPQVKQTEDYITGRFG